MGFAILQSSENTKFNDCTITIFLVLIGYDSGAMRDIKLNTDLMPDKALNSTFTS